jgi:HlyD family secretion protein
MAIVSSFLIAEDLNNRQICVSAESQHVTIGVRETTMPRLNAHLISVLGMGFDEPTDADLLSRFIAERDLGAFELLVWRHTAIVMRVCRSILRDRHEAEDAAQATFLALARQAKAIREANIAGWLFRVAQRVSMRSARRFRKQPAMADINFDQLPAPTPRQKSDSQLERILHEELVCLPEKYQLPIILCFFEGHTYSEAAQRLNCSIGTVAGRVSRAKRLLELRLNQRRVSLAGLVIATSAIPPSFGRVTAIAATAFAHGSVSGLSKSVLELANHEVSRMFTMKAIRWISVLVCGVVAFSFGWASEPTKAPLPQLELATATPKRQTIRHEILQPGILEPYEEVAITSKISGFLEKVYVDIGDKVKKGDVLAKLWVPEIEEDVRVKKARIVQREAELKLAKFEVTIAEAVIEVGEGQRNEAVVSLARADAEYARWDKEVQRNRELNARNVLDKQTLNESINQLKVAEAALSKAREKVGTLQGTLKLSRASREKATTAVEIAQAKLEVAKTEYQEQLVWLDYANLRAPFDGIVARRISHTEHFVQPANSGTTSKAAEPLFVVMRTDILRVVVDVPEYDAPLVKDGAEAIVRLTALKDREIACKVSRTTWLHDGETRLLRVEILLDDSREELRPRMYANVLIPVGVPAAWTLPVEAILTDGAVKYCFLVENGKATRRNVKVGISDKGAVEVLAKQMPPAKAGEEGVWVKFTGAERAVIFDLRSIEESKAMSKVKP